MVVYQKWFEDEIARWKVRQPRYDLSKQLKKIHKQQHGKMGSGARPTEAVPKGRRDLTRRAPVAGSTNTSAASKWQRPCHAGAWSERTAGTADRDELPQHRRTKRRCTSSLSSGGWDAAGSLTNAGRERPPPPCGTWCDERQTHFSISPR